MYGLRLTYDNAGADDDKTCDTAGNGLDEDPQPPRHVHCILNKGRILKLLNINIIFIIILLTQIFL